jgi:hypothetical protein
MAIRYSKIYRHLPLKGPPKFTQNGIFGLKLNHLATLADIREKAPLREKLFGKPANRQKPIKRCFLGFVDSKK